MPGVAQTPPQPSLAYSPPVHVTSNRVLKGGAQTGMLSPATEASHSLGMVARQNRTTPRRGAGGYVGGRAVPSSSPSSQLSQLPQHAWHQNPSAASDHALYGAPQASRGAPIETGMAMEPLVMPVPGCFRCPLTRNVMHQPVATHDGQVYELSAIEEWFRKGYRTSPVTGLELENLVLNPQPALQVAIAAFMAHPSAPREVAGKFVDESGVSTRRSGTRSQENGGLNKRTSTSSPRRPPSHHGSQQGSQRPESRRKRAGAAPSDLAATNSDEAAEVRRLLDGLQSELRRAEEEAATSAAATSILTEPMEMARQVLSSAATGGTGAPTGVHLDDMGIVAGESFMTEALSKGGYSSSQRSPSRQRSSAPKGRDRSLSAARQDRGSRDRSLSQAHSRDVSPTTSAWARRGETGRLSRPSSAMQQPRRMSSQNTSEGDTGNGNGRLNKSRTTPRRPTQGELRHSDSQRSFRPSGSPGSQRVNSPSRRSGASPPSSPPQQARSPEYEYTYDGPLPPGYGPGKVPRCALPRQQRQQPQRSPAAAHRASSSTRSSQSLAARPRDPGSIQASPQTRHRTVLNASSSSTGVERRNLTAALAGASRSKAGLEQSQRGGISGSSGSSSLASAPHDSLATCEEDRQPKETDHGRGMTRPIAEAADGVWGQRQMHGGQWPGQDYFSREEQRLHHEEAATSYAQAAGFITPAWAQHDQAEDSSSLERGRSSNINETDEAGRTALMHAAGEGDVQALRRQLSRGADIDATDECRCTALMYAATYGHLEAVRLLCESGAAIEATSKDGWTPLITAAYNGHLEVVSHLLTRDAWIEAADERGWTSLMHVAFNGDNDTLRCLLQHNAEVDKLDSDGRTALVYAAFNGHLENVRCLLEKSGNDVTNVPLLDGARDTALLFAAIHGHVEVVNLLLEVAAASPETRHAALKLAADHGHHAVVELLVRRSAVDLQYSA